MISICVALQHDNCILQVNIIPKLVLNIEALHLRATEPAALEGYATPERCATHENFALEEQMTSVQFALVREMEIKRLPC